MFEFFKRFKFFLDDGTKDAPYELPDAPEDWDKIQVAFERSPKYWGVNRLFVFPIKFVGVGAFLIRRQFYQFLVGAKLLFLIQILGRDGFNYEDLYTGRIDVSQFERGLTSASAPVIADDFTAKINAYSDTQFSISLNQPSAINLELTPIALDEIADLVPYGPPDGIRHSDYFPPIAIVNNTQNSANPSVQNVSYGQIRNPDFSAVPNWCFNCQYTGKLLMRAFFSILIQTFGSGRHLRLALFNQNGDIVYSFYDQVIPGTVLESQVITANTVIDVAKGDKLFLYMQQVDPESTLTGIDITGGTISFSYKTSTPASMCKALRAVDLFPLILKAMNLDPSGPNLPIPTQSALLSNALKNVVFTSADSIRKAVGSIYRAGDVLYPGSYKVLNGTVNYNAGVFTTDEVFTYINGVETYTSGDGALVQKIQSVSVGAVFNIGDTLQAGGTYLVQGDAGEYAIYNGIHCNVGQSFIYVLGQTSFTGSNDSIFVKQTAEDAQIIISLDNFYKDIQGIQCGDAAFGWDTTGASAFAYIETLGYVFRKAINSASLGIVDSSAKNSTALDLIGSKLKIGYADKQYSSLNGSVETNSQQSYTSGLLTPDNELDLTCADRADCIGIEEIRITQADTAASRSDNDTFMVWIKDEPEAITPLVYYHPLRTEGLKTNPDTGLPMISGVPLDFYNWKLSPKQNFNRGSRYLASVFYGLNGYQLRMASGLKNTAMVTTDINGLRIAEAELVEVSSLTDPYFIPLYWDLAAAAPKTLLDIFNTSPFSTVDFDFDGINVKAFISKFTLQIGDDKPQSVKLLMSPDNDLTKLI